MFMIRSNFSERARPEIDWSIDPASRGMVAPRLPGSRTIGMGRTISLDSAESRDEWPEVNAREGVDSGLPGSGFTN
jgi:hypothetical protein